MKPSEVRQRLLDDHAELRRRLAQVHGHLVTAGDTGAGRASAELTDLLELLLEHVEREDTLLPELLLEDFGYGPERLTSMFAHHRMQREQIAAWKSSLAADPGAAAALHSEIRDALIADMNSEEADLLSEENLRDDTVQVAFGG